MVIVYKVSPLSYWLARALINVKYIGLINLIAGKEIVPELIQRQASPENISETVYEILNDPVGLEQMQANFLKAKAQLGGPGGTVCPKLRVTRLMSLMSHMPSGTSGVPPVISPTMEIMTQPSM